MNLQELKKLTKVYNPALFLEDILPFGVRFKAGRYINLALIISFLLASGVFGDRGNFFWGLFFVMALLRLKLFLLDALYYSYYFRGSNFVLEEPGLLEAPMGIDFDTALLAHQINEKDITYGFVDSALGMETMSRLGIDRKDINKFLAGDRVAVWSNRLIVEGNLSINTLAQAIFETDKDFANFLFGFGIDKKVFGETIAWISRINDEKKRKMRFWGRDYLGRISSIGKNWSYGVAYILERHSTDIRDMKIFQDSVSANIYFKNEIDSLESVLAKRDEANVVIVSEKGTDPLGIVSGLCRKILSGEVLPSLEYKKIMVLDTNNFVANAGSKTFFESDFLNMLGEASRAGNIILVIPDFTSFIVSAKTIGVDVASLMDPYLASSNVQFIAIADPSSFNEVLEGAGVMERFEVLRPKIQDALRFIYLVEDFAFDLERRTGLYFTYPAIKEIISGADRYFVGGVMPDKALDLLSELVPFMKKREEVVVRKTHVIEIIESKTGIPAGDIKEGEKEKLLNLEEVLHGRVVGQDEAINMISNAMRRARSGISNPNRPFGSFLFLGPTGVGKTETAKALAQVFFGDDKKMVRLDMSEYNTNEGLERLIGSFETKTPGVLASLLRDEPYGVLLLDEFEKTNKDVLDLFLQILDEGVFSDMNGKKVNVRNMIIIATSNAGSDLIWQLVKNNRNLAEEKNNVIDEIVSRGVFKPELLNRFDGTVLFHPLDKDSLQKIARLMLEKFSVRLKAKGLLLDINQDLVDFLVAEGNDPQFGARPLNRAIQEKVEKVIAEKMIRGEVKAGSKIVLTKTDLV